MILKVSIGELIIRYINSFLVADVIKAIVVKPAVVVIFDDIQINSVQPLQFSSAFDRASFPSCEGLDLVVDLCVVHVVVVGSVPRICALRLENSHTISFFKAGERVLYSAFKSLSVLHSLIRKEVPVSCLYFMLSY